MLRNLTDVSPSGGAPMMMLDARVLTSLTITRQQRAEPGGTWKALPTCGHCPTMWVGQGERALGDRLD